MGKTNFLFIVVLWSMLFLGGCIPVQEEKSTGLNLDLNEISQQKLYDYQDRRVGDSLINFFEHTDPSLRYISTLSFASMNLQEPKYLDALVPLLSDELMSIRSVAAYAIGQLGKPRGESYLVEAFVAEDSMTIATGFNRTVLEAIGKIGSLQSLKHMASVKTYAKTDTLLLEGQALGIYRFGLRGITDDLGTERMVKFLTEDYPDDIQYLAANYLFRNRSLDLSKYVDELLPVFEQNKNIKVALPLCIALGRTKSPLVLEALQRQFPRAQDYRLKCNIIRALGSFKYQEVEPVIASALTSGNWHISNTAADYFLAHGTFYDCNKYIQKAKNESGIHWSVRNKLYGAANKYLPYTAEGRRRAIEIKLQEIFESNPDINIKLSAIEAYGQYAWNFRKIFDLYKTSNSSLMKSKAIAVLGLISARPDFNQYFGASKRRVKRELAIFFQEAIESRDVGVVTEAATAIANKELGLNEFFETSSFLTLAQLRLDLPKEIEGYNALQKAIDFFNGSSTTTIKTPGYNHPIDWEILKEMGRSPKVTFETTKGSFEFTLLPDLAPATCINFFQLAKSGFFNGKNFHRVVSNFVVQGGCTRGDGYGSLDYTIRSEFAPAYYDDEGWVGMASAGPHTECSQFFVTHAPTPHLDGKYSLFGKVTSGMDIVHNLIPGDLIKNVKVKK